MLLLTIILQTAIAAPEFPPDSVYGTPYLREFIARAAVENRAPPASLTGYRAAVESELALILRDSLGRELVGQIEQLAARAEWERSGRYDLHVVGYRSQLSGAPYSALTFTRMWTVPTLYGNRLVIGLNEGISWQRPRDTVALRRRAERDSARRREPYRAVHPLAADRDRYYRFTGGDSVATVFMRDRAIRLVRVFVEPVVRPGSNFEGFHGQIDFDADRHQLVRMRGRLVTVRNEKASLVARAMGAVAVAFIEFENAEVNGRYWLPAFQWSEFQAQLGLLGETRPIYRIVSRFRNYSTHDTVVTLADADSIVATLAPTRARLSFAAGDSASRFDAWTEELGIASGRVSADDFADIAPDQWKPDGPPRVDPYPRRLQDAVRYNRVEGLFTGTAASVRFRDMAPGVTARATIGWAWTEETVRGGGSVSLARGGWTLAARADRALATTNDFLLPLENGLSIFPLITGEDDHDYVDRRSAGLAATRLLQTADRGFVSAEVAYVDDRPEFARLSHAAFHGGAPLRLNRAASPGRYVRATTAIELHPGVSAGSLASGVGARISHEIAAGDLDWQRIEARLAARRYWRGFVAASSLDAGMLLGNPPPPQALFELGGTADLTAYDYKEFGGDRAALGRAVLIYQLPILATPRRIIGRIVLPGLSPGLGAGIQAGWADASSDAVRRSLIALGGDGVTPLSRPTDGIRATADVRLTFLAGAMGVGLSRAIDHGAAWKPFFVLGGTW